MCLFVCYLLRVLWTYTLIRKSYNNAEIKLSIQPCFPHTTRLMVFIQSLFISSLRMKAEIKLSIQPCFPHTTRLMVIIHIHLMISLAECRFKVQIKELMSIKFVLRFSFFVLRFFRPGLMTAVTFKFGLL